MTKLVYIAKANLYRQRMFEVHKHIVYLQF